MRMAGFGLSIFFVAAGAVLAWAVTYETEGIDLNTVGVILFVVGAIGALTTLVMEISSRNRTVEHDRQVVAGQNGTHEVVRETVR